LQSTQRAVGRSPLWSFQVENASRDRRVRPPILLGRRAGSRGSSDPTAMSILPMDSALMSAPLALIAPSIPAGPPHEPASTSWNGPVPPRADQGFFADEPVPSATSPLGALARPACLRPRLMCGLHSGSSPSGSAGRGRAWSGRPPVGVEPRACSS